MSDYNPNYVKVSLQFFVAKLSSPPHTHPFYGWRQIKCLFSPPPSHKPINPVSPRLLLLLSPG